MNQALNMLQDEIRGAARFRWLAMIVAWAVCVIGWLVVFRLPNVFESTARVYVDTRTALSPVIQGLAIEQDVYAQLSLVQQALLGEAQLGKVVDEANLASDPTSTRARALAIAQLRNSITINIMGGDRNRPGVGLYSISYQDSERDRSLEVVQILLDSFVQSTLGGKQKGSETAERFLTEQIAETEQRLRDAEQRLADFKKKNVGTMPGAEGDYFTRLQNEMEASRKAQAALSVALSRRSELAQQLRDGASAAAATGSTSTAGVSAGSGQPAVAGDTASRIVDAQRRLTDLLLRYTEKHPEVGTLRDEISELEQRRARELDALRRGDPDAVVASGAGANPVYQSIQLALNQTSVEIAALRGEIAQHERKIAELRAVVQTVPEVEAEFARLNRDYDVTRTQYVALVERLGRAKLGQEAEATSAIVFEIVDPPTADFQPVDPNRPRLIVMVFVAGIGLGVGLAYALNKLRPVFNHRAELEAFTGVPVLGEVSLATLDNFVPDERRGHLLFSAGAIGLAVACIAALVLQSRVY
jgi:polysaccharide chain length determinant protein (PEP-CTERM system associated)